VHGYFFTHEGTTLQLKETICLFIYLFIQYNVGDCLYDAITHLLKYSVGSKMIQKNSMSHLKNNLKLKYLKL
jgi:hypothetical protein